MKNKTKSKFNRHANKKQNNTINISTININTEKNNTNLFSIIKNGIFRCKSKIKDHLVLYIIFLVCAFVLYANSLNGEFLTADDLGTIVNNEIMHNLTQSIKTLNPNLIVNSLIYQVFGLNPLIYHVRSILLHSINTFLVFLVVKYLFDKKTALFTTILFLTHPLATEAVSWISGSVYLFFALFNLLIILFYILFIKNKNIHYLIIALTFYIIYIVTMESAWVIITPFFLITIDQFILNKKIKVQNFKYYVSFILPMTIFLFLWFSSSYTQRLTALKEKYYHTQENTTPFLNRLPYTIYKSSELYLVPYALTIYHEGEHISKVLYTFMVVFTFIFFGSLIYLLKKKRLYFGLIFMVLISISPSLSPVAVAWFVADRYLYMGIIFFSLTVVLLISEMEKKYKIKDLLFILVIVITLMYSTRTFIRNFDWKNERNIWFATKKIAPYSHRVYNNIGNVYFIEKNYQKAIESFQISIQLKPDFADAVHNLGSTYMSTGNTELAKQYLLKSLEMNPNLYQSTYKLGVIEYENKNYETAKNYFYKTLEINPEFTKAEEALKKIEIVESR